MLSGARPNPARRQHTCDHWPNPTCERHHGSARSANHTFRYSHLNTERKRNVSPLPSPPSKHSETPTSQATHGDCTRKGQTSGGKRHTKVKLCDDSGIKEVHIGGLGYDNKFAGIYTTLGKNVSVEPVRPGWDEVRLFSSGMANKRRT